MRNDPVVIDLTDPDYWTDPYPRLRAARASGRTARTHSGETVLLRAEDADVAYTDPRFTVPGLGDLERLGIFDGPFYEWRRHTLAVMEGADHRRLRAFVGPAFMPRQLQRLRGFAAERARGLVERGVERGEMEVLTEFAGDLPLWTLCRYLGIADEDRAGLGSFLIGLEEGFTSPMTPERRQRVETAVVALNRFVARIIAQGRERPATDTVLGTLIEAQRSAHADGPSDAELQSLIVNLIGGAVGSTRAALTNAVLELARHPDQAALLRREPQRVPAAVEECLRFHPPFRFGRRVLLESTRIFDVDFKAGDAVFIPRQAINRDPARFNDPDCFDVTRPQARHFSFSYGAHFCLGQAVARTNLQEGLRVLLSLCDDLRVLEEPRRVPFVPDEQIQSLRIGFRYRR